MRPLPLATLLLLLLPCALPAQGWIEPPPAFTGSRGVVRVRTEIDVRVEGRIAQVEVDEWFENRGSGLGEGDYLYPLPGEAVFTNLSLFQGDEELRGETMDASTARGIYEEIVRRRRDPALVELAGHGLIRARVFPIGPGETRRITLRYTQLLPRAGDGLQFRYAAGMRQGGVTEGTPLAFRITIQDGAQYRDPYSPTHRVTVRRQDGRITVSPTGELTGNFSVFLPFAARAVGMTLATHRPAAEDGYFMLTLSPGEVREGRSVPRDLIAVVDVSGSMSGGKLRQAQDALRQLLGTIGSQDRFRLVAFGSAVRTQSEGWSGSSAAELESAARWVEALEANGGTNIAGALGEAFRLEPRRNALPVVVFLTDGLPSVGEQDPERLASLAGGGSGRARVFPFGIGYDVNTHLLDRLGQEGRGTTEYVEPGENVEDAVGRLATRIRHPVLTDLEIERQPVRLTDLVPERLPDLFAGEELVIFGRYRPEAGTTRGALQISGLRNGRQERFAVQAEFPAHRAADEYIARLWASRRLGELARRIRLEGAHPELVEEARGLALRHGLLSEYSAYLVLEPNMTTSSGPGVVSPESAGGRRPPAVAPAAVGADAVRRADRTAQQLKVRSEAELLELTSAAVSARPDERTLAGRRFRLNVAVWTDAAHRDEGTTVVRVEPFSEAYFDLLQTLPELRPIWSELERTVVAGREVSIEVAPGGRAAALSSQELARIVAAFRGS